MKPAGGPVLGLLALAGACMLGGCSARTAGTSAAQGRHDAVLSLAPDPANSASRIAVVFADARMRTADCRYEWRRNGSVIAGAEHDGLDPRNFSKNDEIEVILSAPDPAGGAVRKLSAKVHVVNSPPKLIRATLAATTVSGAAELQANVECVDPDGEIPSYSYRWFKNGALLEDASGPRLPMSRMGRGDQVVAEVTARDDASESVPLRSDLFTVDNRPPVFSSQPLSPKAGDAAFQYRAISIDPDGDALRYELITGPPGMTVDPAGNLYWMMPRGDQRPAEFPVRIRATDTMGGQATQDFTVRLGARTSGS